MSASTKQDKASAFAMTCNLLSQFIKDKGSLGDLALEMAIGKSDTYRPPSTMNLLQGVDASGNYTRDIVPERNDTKSMDLFPQHAASVTHAPVAADNRKPGSPQLTIFYGGKVMVFDNFPPNKANDLMMLAGKGCDFNPSKLKIANSNSTMVAASTNTPVMQPISVQTVASADLPIARKASLHRFLEKRKDRINAKAPYQINQKKEFLKEENQPWLALTSTPNTKH